jgi:hypothetical protein
VSIVDKIRLKQYKRAKKMKTSSSNWKTTLLMDGLPECDHEIANDGGSNEGGEEN